MEHRIATKVADLVELRDHVHLFDDRCEAGAMLADMLAGQVGDDPMVLGVAAGGVAVGAPIARGLGAGLHVAVVNKITPPWHTEWGFGAVAFDGSVVFDESSLRHAGVDRIEQGQCTQRARDTVNRRLELLASHLPPADLSGRTVVVVDDGLATGITMRGAIGAVQRSGAGEIVIAIPTAHWDPIDWFAAQEGVSAIYCLNIRSGSSFSVAQAYRNWTNMTDAEIQAILAEF